MKLLDLYCGEGLAAWGYWRSARFSEIVGVDINPKLKTRYAFDFVQADALTLDYNFLLQFDFIHASPPCQAYSKATPDPSKHIRLIAATHLMLVAAGKPYVIENVEGSSRELRPNLVMNGTAMGLPIERRRYFHVSTLDTSIRLINMSSETNLHIHGDYLPRTEMIKAMGISEMINRHRLNKITRKGIEQGIPPAMTKYIAELIFSEKYMVA